MDLEMVLLEKEKFFVFDINIKAIDENKGAEIRPPYFNKSKLFILAGHLGLEQFNPYSLRPNL